MSPLLELDDQPFAQLFGAHRGRGHATKLADLIWTPAGAADRHDSYTQFLHDCLFHLRQDPGLRARTLTSVNHGAARMVAGRWDAYPYAIMALRRLVEAVCVDAVAAERELIDAFFTDFKLDQMPRARAARVRAESHLGTAVAKHVHADATALAERGELTDRWLRTRTVEELPAVLARTGAQMLHSRRVLLAAAHIIPVPSRKACRAAAAAWTHAPAAARARAGLAALAA